MEVVNIHLCRIMANKKNPRTIRDENFTKLINSILATPSTLSLDPIVIDGDTGIILGGNMRYNALLAISRMDCDSILRRLWDIGELGGDAEKINRLSNYWREWLSNTTAPVVEAVGLTEEEKRSFVIKDNASFGEWDYDMLANEYDVDELCDWCVDVPDFSEKAELDTYTRKVEIPIYEPDGRCVDVEKLVDRKKADELIEEINNSSVSEEEKNFLRIAAERHCVFDYENAAEYYAKASSEMQQLMEKSALVIIDFDKAIEYGFVRLNEKINEIYDSEN